MAWYLTQSLTKETENAGANKTTYRVRVYLCASGYNAYGQGYAANGGGDIDGQGFSWTGPTDVSLNNACIEIYTTTKDVEGDPSGYHATVYSNAWFNGGGGFAPGYITAAQASAPGFDFVRTPSAPASVTAVKSGSNIVVTSGDSGTYAGLPILGYYVSYASSSNGGSTWSAWSGESTMTSKSYTYVSPTPGLTYKFRVRSNNADGYSGYTESATLFLTAGGKRFNGTNFVLTSTAAKRFNGSSFQSFTIAKRFDGSSWVNLS